MVAGFAFSRNRGRLAGLSGDMPERLGRPSEADLAKLAGRPVLWLHAASSGEVSAAEPFAREAKERFPGVSVLLTCTTRSGREAGRKRPVFDACVLAPADFWWAVSSFLRRVRPYALVLVETELWPTTLHLAERAGLKLGVVNGRVSDRSFPRYRLASPFLRPFLRLFERVSARSETDLERYRRLGVPPERLFCPGNLKFDQTAAGDPEAVRARLSALGWSASPLFVAGSTHPVEEEQVLSAYLSARGARPGLKLVVVPRHVERAGDAVRTLEAAGLEVRRWSEDARQGGDALVVDAMGVLGALYALCEAAFVGGTLVPVGGHNLLEPALAGKVVLFGPRSETQKESAALLLSAGCACQVQDAAELGERLRELLSDPERSRAQGQKALELMARLQGASKRAVEHLTPVLTPPKPEAS